MPIRRMKRSDREEPKMKHERSRKKSLKQKLAAAMSLVNVLNVAAPIALPYVNMAR